MKYLLDTHTFLWTTGKSHRLSKKARSAIIDPKNEIFVSSVTFWEIAIKARSGKLNLGGTKPEYLIDRAREMDIQLMPLEPGEAATSGNMTEDSHFDPFDRMLIWQAINRKMVLVSRDSSFKRFEADGLALLWD